MIAKTLRFDNQIVEVLWTMWPQLLGLGMRWTLALLLIQALLSVNCGMTRVIDNQDAYRSYEKGLADVDEEIRRLSEAIESQRARYLRLKNAEVRPSADQREGLKQRVKAASSGLSKIKQIREAMIKQMKALDDFAKDHPKVREQETSWSKADALHQEMARQFSNFNSQLAETSQNLNDLNRFWSQSGLMLRHSTQSLANEIEDLRTRWQSAYSELVANYNLGQKRYSKWLNEGPRRTASSEKILRPLQTLHTEIGHLSDLSSSFDKIRKDFARSYSQRAEMTSLDRDWQAWLEFRKRFIELKEQVQEQVSQCSHTYDRVLDGLKE